MSEAEYFAILPFLFLLMFVCIGTMESLDIFNISVISSTMCTFDQTVGMEFAKSLRW